MENKKGFTLIELLAVIMIIAILSSIGVVSYRTFFRTGEQRYYDAVESNVLLAGNDYFLDHRSELPIDSGYSQVSLADLIGLKYLEQVKDSSGVNCSNGKVVAYRSGNQYKYEACIECGTYQSTGRYCGNISGKEITVSGRTKNTGVAYDVTKSYSAVSYAKNENVIVSLSMNFGYDIAEYRIENTKTNVLEPPCIADDANVCEAEISSSGTYKVTSYDSNGQAISSKYINVKISGTGSLFTLTTEKPVYMIEKDECNNGISTKKVKINIVPGENSEEYKAIEYRINGGAYQSTDRLTIEEELESGHYTIDVVVTNYSDVTSSESISFDIGYYVGIHYDDDNSETTHEVVKGQTYNYLKTLPTEKLAYGQNLEIKWYVNNTRVYGTNVVSGSCSYTMVGKTAIPVAKPTTSLCVARTYNGSAQQLTSITSGTGYTLSGYNQTAANEDGYTITATLANGYVWNDNTTGTATFKCPLSKAAATLTCVDKTYNGSAQNLYTASGCTSVTNGSQTDAGSWTLTCVTDSNHSAPSTCEATMNKAESYIECKSAQNYSGSAITAYSDSSNCESYTNGAPTAAGTYTVTCNGGSNYENSTCSFTINKVNATCPTTTAYSAEYDGNAHTIGISGGSGGTIKYSSDNSTWSNTNPKRTATGKQTTYVKVVGDANHNNVTCTSRTITIYTSKTATIEGRSNSGTATFTGVTAIVDKSATNGATVTCTSVSSGSTTCTAKGITGKSATNNSQCQLATKGLSSKYDYAIHADDGKCYYQVGASPNFYEKSSQGSPYGWVCAGGHGGTQPETGGHCPSKSVHATNNHQYCNDVDPCYEGPKYSWTADDTTKKKCRCMGKSSSTTYYKSVITLYYY